MHSKYLYWICFIIAIFAILFIASLARASECFPSAAAVWNEHPNSHAYWHLNTIGHEGQRCWDNVPAPTKPATRRKHAAGSRGKEVVDRVYGRASVSAKWETKTHVADSHADVALSAAITPPPGDPVERIARLLDQTLRDAYMERVKQLVDYGRRIYEQEANH